MDSKKLCPYCGEEIAASAKKCRFCGEWLEEEQAVLVPETVEAETVGYAEPLGELNVAGQNGPDGIPATVNVNGMPQNYPGQMVNPNMMQQPMQQPMQQSMMQPVINIQLAQETVVNQEVNQEVNQNVNVESGKSSSSGFLWFELAAVGGAVWWGTGHWWAGLITWFVLIAAMQIPVIGTVLCFVLGGGIGLLAGIISAAFGAPTWACWLIGIVVGIGVSALNMEDKDADD